MSCEVRLCQVRSGKARLNQILSGQAWLGREDLVRPRYSNVSSIYASLGQGSSS
jgi:hypothetical protein